MPERAGGSFGTNLATGTELAPVSHWDAREFFSPDEFESPERIDAGLVSLLELARASAGIPFHITSGYRPTDGTLSAHHIGKAVDIRANDTATRFLIVRALILAGFRRIGIYDRHVHADVAAAEDGFPVDVLWWGKSR